MDRAQTGMSGHVLPRPVLEQQDVVQMGFSTFVTCRLGLGCGWVGSVGEEKVGGGGRGS